MAKLAAISATTSTTCTSKGAGSRMLKKTRTDKMNKGERRREEARERPYSVSSSSAAPSATSNVKGCSDRDDGDGDGDDKENHHHPNHQRREIGTFHDEDEDDELPELSELLFLGPLPSSREKKGENPGTAMGNRRIHQGEESLSKTYNEQPEPESSPTKRTTARSRVKADLNLLGSASATTKGKSRSGAGGDQGRARRGVENAVDNSSDMSGVLGGGAVGGMLLSAPSRLSRMGDEEEDWDGLLLAKNNDKQVTRSPVKKLRTQKLSQRQPPPGIEETSGLLSTSTNTFTTKSNLPISVRRPSRWAQQEQKQERRSHANTTRAIITSSLSSSFSSSLTQNDEAAVKPSAATRRQRPLKLAHVDSLLLPLSSIDLEPMVAVVEEQEGEEQNSPPPAPGIISESSVPQLTRRHRREQPQMRPPPQPTKTTRREKSTKAAASRFVIQEARCNDDLAEDTDISEDDEDAATDLSGFIVGDDEDLSFHDNTDASDDDKGSSSDEPAPWTGSEKEPNGRRRKLGVANAVAPPSHRPSPTKTNPSAKGRLRRGPPPLQRTLFTEDGNEDDDKGGDEDGRDDAGPTSHVRTMAPDEEKQDTRPKPQMMDIDNNAIEIIDLTASPTKLDQPYPEARKATKDEPDSGRAGRKKRSPSKKKLLDDDDENTTKNPNNLFANEDDSGAFLRISPPPRPYRSPSKTESPAKNSSSLLSSRENTIDATNSPRRGEVAFTAAPTTPTTTPPPSPSKLNPPTKLLSPSKRATQIPRSPHRPSLDAFWSSDVINDWNDQYSPKKAPLTSPRKGGGRFARFDIWGEDEDEDEDEAGEAVRSSSSPSPCSSPRKSTTMSPSKTQQQKKSASEEKKALAARKKQFEANRESVAQALLDELDRTICAGKLARLSQSTGGVKIIWSNSLRSTAGRANWRRTVARSDECAGSAAGAGAGVKIQHFAHIELAEKVIDSEERLVNTLAHEFCHLANFMVSGVKDQPHGASFKAWADKVTSTLRKHPTNPLYRAVEVTTKHNYVINHKYLWICAGGAAAAGASATARDFLAIRPDDDDDLGCGAEYGRHSKSIDPERHRCGKCKGKLVQVRPKPRQLDPRRTSPRKGVAGGVNPFKKKIAYQDIGLDGTNERENGGRSMGDGYDDDDDDFKAMEREMRLLELSE